LIGPHESSVTGAKQKLCVDERTQQRVAGCPIKAPQPLRLRRRQPKPGHLDVLALHAPKDVVKRLLLCCHDGAPPELVPEKRRDRGYLSNPDATGVWHFRVTNPER
jgi:hypothetical protein